ncbi:MAG: RluA family pseudouridine synthase [Chloroflexi bacterium]|nr:RluA family pseudouridine synthase [Chloroflexota bacterium]
MPDRLPVKPVHFTRANGIEHFEVPPYANRMRLDAFLGKYGEGRSRTEWARLIEDGSVTVDGRRLRPGDRVATGQRVQAVTRPPVQIERPQPAAQIPLTIVYEDPAMIVVNKPPGLVVHPAPGHDDGTLVNALLARFPDLDDPSGEHRPGIVHRLDKDTSGLLVIGRTTAAMAALQHQFKERLAEKHYLLLVQGDIAEAEAAIEAPIARDTRDRKRMAARSSGREARTGFTVLERYGDFTLVDADLQSGRTHQLRVHFQFIGHPVAGDRTYGNGRGPSGLRRQFVHAWSMRIQSPHDGEERRFFTALPGDLRSPLERLRSIRGFGPETLPPSVLGGKNPPSIAGGEVVPVPGQPGRSTVSPDTRPPASAGGRAGGAKRSPRASGGSSAPSQSAGDRRPPWSRSAAPRPKRGPRP